MIIHSIYLFYLSWQFFFQITHEQDSNVTTNEVTEFITYCIEGCLKCKNQKCLFCDYTNGYYYQSSGACQQLEVLNCDQINYDGACITCKIGYYVDSNKVCQSIPEGDVITNCAVYLNSNTCKYCITGFYLSGNSCVEVQNPIDNCSYYASETTCDVCDEGSFLYIDKKYCIYLESFTNCAFWSQLHCTSCIGGYYFNKNGYLLDLFSNGQNIDLMYSYIMNRFQGNIYSFITQVCVPTEIKNCQIYESSTKCSQCNDGYLLIENYCVKSTTSVYSTCYKTNDETGQCIQCIQGYFISDGSCSQVEEIDNCILYDSTKTRTVCSQCQDDFYLDKNKNQCKTRTFSKNIENCQILEIDSEECKECIIDNVLTDDSLKCLQPILNCQTYMSSNIYSSSLRCQQCINGYYNDSQQGICVQGTLANCQIYKTYSNECLKCDNEYFLDSDHICKQHSLSSSLDCQQFSNKVDNLCLSCKNNQIKITNRNFCKNIQTIINNCIYYASATTCRTCDNGFILSPDGSSCNQGPVNNCKIYESPLECAVCDNFQYNDIEIPYILSDDKLQCKQPIIEEYQECAQVGTNKGINSCVACKQNYYPKNYMWNTRICLSTSEWILNPTLNSAKLSNCEIWDQINENCLKCKNNLLVENGICVSTCTGTKVKHLREIIINKDKNVIVNGRENYCEEPPVNAVANCSLYDTSVRSDTNEYNGQLVVGCVECESDYYGVIQLDDNSIAGQATTWNIDNSKMGEGNRYTFFSFCYDKVYVLTNLFHNTSQLDNCKLILKDRGQDKFGCFACEHGYTGTVVEYSVIDINTGDYLNAEYYIESCQVMSSCNSSVWYHSLKNPYPNIIQISNYFKFPLDNYISCHECINSNEIVFFGISIGQTRQNTSPPSPVGGLAEYSMLQDPPYLVNGDAMSQTVCSLPNPGSIDLRIPDNCAIVIVVTELTNKGYTEDNQTENDSAFKCLSCKPGYYPSYDNKKFINQCTQIANCSIVEFNGCRQCDDNYSFYYSMNHRTTFKTQCNDSSTVPYCYSGISTSNGFYCKQCKEGYALTNDGYCDELNIKECNSFSSFQSFATTTNYPLQTEPFEYLMERKPSGCLTCSSGYVATFLPQYVKQLFCTKNVGLAENNILTSDKFVNNCLITYLDSTLNKVRCLKCADTYTLVSGKCILITVDNETLNLVGECESFDYYTQRCSKCKNYYFLNGGICYKGFIANCLVYNSISKCSECEVGYVALALTPTKSICFKISDSFQCEKWSTEASNVGELECLKCGSGLYQEFSYSNYPPYLCFDIESIENCENYDISYSIKLSSFDCVKCKDGYYLISNFCIERTTIKNCLTYNPYADRCQICENGFQLTSSYECEEAISSNSQSSACEVYFASDQCLKCSPNWYLDTKSQECKYVVSQSRINHCLYYRQPEECESCDAGYFLTDDECKKASALNCESYLSVSQCKTCPKGYGLIQNTDNSIDCIKSDLENCKQINPDVFYPFECQNCEQDFYLTQNNQCEAVETKIDFCEIYQNANHCSKCQSQKALSEAQEGCFSSSYVMGKTDTYCAVSYMRSLPKCEICDIGTYWYNDSCTSCLSLTPDSGCMFCDPNSEYTCLICMPGYFMNDNYQCIRIAIVDSGNTSYQFVIKISLILLLMIIS